MESDEQILLEEIIAAILFVIMLIIMIYISFG